jgi:hypothetical protein
VVGWLLCHLFALSMLLDPGVGDGCGPVAAWWQSPLPTTHWCDALYSLFCAPGVGVQGCAMGLV